jgi:hypothetical protein
MLNVYGVCVGRAQTAVEEYCRWFHTCRISDRRVFHKIFNTLRECGTLPSAPVSSERARQQNVEEQENILEMVQLSPTTSTRRLSTRLGVSRTRVWRALYEDGLHEYHPQRVQNLHPGDSAMRLEFCHWLHTNRKLFPLILFTDEAIFTRNGIKNTRLTRIDSLTKIHMVLSKQMFNAISLSVCVDCSRYLRSSYDRTKLPRFSAKWITRTTRGCFFDQTDCYVLSAWRSPFSLNPTSDATSQWHFALSVDR